MLVVAIDGACRRNGKPDCISAGGVFVLHLDSDLNVTDSTLLSNYEIKSTNQRGELLALLTSLDYIHAAHQPAQIITDSEYLFNSVTKEWCNNWANKGWVTATGEPVKNKDIWLEIVKAQRRCEEDGIDISYYHVKGHAVSFGKVTAQNLLAKDTSGMLLYETISDRVDVTNLKDGMYEQIVDLSIKNNGFKPSDEIMKRFVVTNTVADAIATKCVEAADALMK